MTTAFASLQASLVAAMQAAISGAVVHSNRVRPLPADACRAVLVERVDAREIKVLLGCSDWQTTFSAVCTAKVAPAQPDADAACDQLLEQVWSAVHALHLDGVIDINLEPSIEWAYDATDVQSASATLRLSIVHRVNATDLQIRS